METPGVARLHHYPRGVVATIDTGTEQLPAHVDDAGVLRVVLNNPSRHNSLTADMMNGLRSLFAAASENNEVSAILVRGEGEDAFASGADIGEQQERADGGVENPDRGMFLRDLQSCTKPVIAMIHGYCIGGGLIVAMAADIRIASESATFSIPPARIGVAYPWAAVHSLVDLVGRGWASDLMLTGDRIDATTARDIGLVTRVEPKADLETATDELLARLVANAPLSLTVSKATIAHATAPTRPPIDDVKAMIDAVWASEDAAEGMEAFFQKRTPQFKRR